MSDTARRLNRDEILGGAITVEDVYIKALNALVPIRRLTSRQRAHVESVSTRGLKVRVGAGASSAALMAGQAPEEVDIQIDLEAQTIAEHDANVITCQYGIAFETPLTTKEVEMIAPEAIKEIAAAIHARSGVTKVDAQRLAEFRNDD